MMKKFSLIAASVAIGLSAFAAQAVEKRAFELLPGAQEKMSNEVLSLRDLSDAGLTRDINAYSWTDDNGTEWKLYMAKIGTFYEFYGHYGDDGEIIPATFEEMPFYRVQVELYDGEKSDIVCVLWWPSKMTIDGKDESIISISDLLSFGLPFEQGPVGSYYWIGEDEPEAWLIAPAEEFKVPSTYNGREGQTATGFKIIFGNYDGARDIDAQFVGTVSGVRVDLPFSGDATILGFDPYTLTWKIGEVNIYEIGPTGSGVSGAYNELFYGPDWGPLMTYYMNFCQEGYKFAAPTLESIPTYPAISSSDEIMKIMFGGGTLFVPNDKEGADGANGIYTMGTYTGIDTYAPNPYELIVRRSDSEFGIYDGLQFVYDGRYWNPVAGSQLGVGDETHGFNYYAQDTYGNTYKFEFTGKINYYPANAVVPELIDACVPGVNAKAAFDPTGAVKEIVADGINGEVAAKVVAANGRINITSDADAAYTIYTVAGQAVKVGAVKAGETAAIDAVAGIYVVKVGNTVVKVAL